MEVTHCGLCYISWWLKWWESLDGFFFFFLAIHFLPWWNTCSDFSSQEQSIMSLSLSLLPFSILFHQVATPSCSQFLFFLVCVRVFRMASTHSNMSLLKIRIGLVVFATATASQGCYQVKIFTAGREETFYENVYKKLTHWTTFLAYFHIKQK